MITPEGIIDQRNRHSESYKNKIIADLTKKLIKEWDTTERPVLYYFERGTGYEIIKWVIDDLAKSNWGVTYIMDEQKLEITASI